MKLIVALFLLINVSASFAFNEVECENTSGPYRIYFSVDDFPRGSSFKDAELSMVVNGTRANWNLMVSRYFTGMNRIIYSGTNLNMDIDLWPDHVPRWGRIYYGTMRSTNIGAGIYQLRCRFPGAN